MNYVGDFALNASVRIPWNTNDGDGASVARSAAGTLRIYRDDSVTQRSSLSGVTDNSDFDSVTGLQLINIDLSDNTDAGFYAAGHDYFVVDVAGTIDAQTVNPQIGHFSIQNRYAAATGVVPTTAQIATAIWTDLLASSDFSTALSIGKLLKDSIDAAITTRMATFTLPTNFSAFAIDASGRVKALDGFVQNVAFADFQFRMSDAAGSPITGLVNADFTQKLYSIGGGANGTLSGTITEDPGGEGFYLISLTAGELNGRSIALTFEAIGSIQTQLTIIAGA